MKNTAEKAKINLDTLQKDIAQAQKELQALRVSNALEPLKNSMQLRTKRRSIARMKTVYNKEINH